jgi:hypothetical protein
MSVNHEIQKTEICCLINAGAGVFRNNGLGSTSAGESTVSETATFCIVAST